MKRAHKFLLCILLLCLITGCDGLFSFGGFPQYTYNCLWRNDKNAIFMYPQLLIPCDNSINGCSFQNVRLENSLNTWSLFMIIDNVLTQSIGSNISLKWTISLTSNKLCSDQTTQSKNIILNRDNFKSYLSFSNADIISKTLYVSESDGFTAFDHKHEMVFQVFDVENYEDGKIGTMTWKVSWDQPSVIDYENWEFTFPKQGIVGTFSPNSYQSGEKRYIYINGHYEYI